MRTEDLLLWLSARSQGSWRQYRAAFEAILEAEESERIGDGDFPLHEQIRLDLQRLAHVEFFTNGCDEGWRVAPPVLAIAQADGGFIGTLCGARCDALLERFRGAAEAKGLRSGPLPNGLTAFVIHSDREEDIVACAVSARIAFQKEAPLAILSSLPAVRMPGREAKTQEFPDGADWNIHEFDTHGQSWGKTQRKDAQSKTAGLFRFTIRFQPARYFLRTNSRSYEVRRAAGVYVLLRKHRRNVVVYDRAGQTLTLPGTCRPQILIERALVLCSGRTPEFDPRTSTLTYRQVNREVASLVGQILLQDIR